MITAIVALTLASGGSIVCPITGEAPMGEPVKFEFEGSAYQLCCSMCVSEFKADPAKALKASAEKGRVVAQFLFDPVNGGKINLEKSKGFSDFGGVRYGFGSAEDKKLFDADPKKYTATPDKEALFCPVEQHPLANYRSAGGFVDYKGVRYYTCCDDCLAEMNTHPEKYAANADKYVQAPKALSIK